LKLTVKAFYPVPVIANEMKQRLSKKSGLLSRKLLAMTNSCPLRDFVLIPTVGILSFSPCAILDGFVVNAWQSQTTLPLPEI